MMRASLPDLRSERFPRGDIQRVSLTVKPFEIDYVLAVVRPFVYHADFSNLQRHPDPSGNTLAAPGAEFQSLVDMGTGGPPVVPGTRPRALGPDES